MIAAGTDTLRSLPSTAQVGVVQTPEDSAIPAPLPATLQRKRPGVEGRFLLAHAFSEFKRIEFAPGFHASTSHLNGQSADSHLISADWFVNPLEKLEIMGVFFKGQNTSIFGALRQGFRVLPDGLKNPQTIHDGFLTLANGLQNGPRSRRNEAQANASLAESETMTRPAWRSTSTSKRSDTPRGSHENPATYTPAARRSSSSGCESVTRG